MVFIHTTCADDKEARKLGDLIIKKKMGACVDFWPTQACFNWKGSFKCVPQVMLLIATFEQKLEEVNELISKNHSYSIPMIAGVDVRRINRPYKEWMMQEVV